MTELTMNYVVNPFASFIKNVYLGILHGMELSAMARAASELRRLGYYKEADKVYEQMRDLKISR